MTSLRDALNVEATKNANHKKCTVGALLNRLNTDDRNALITAMTGRDMSAGSISRALSTSGTEVSADVIVRHRRRVCKCTEEDWRVSE
jgi:hypothetical protein